MEETRFKGPAYETARLKLARIRVEGRRSRDQATRYLIEVASEALTSTTSALWLRLEDSSIWEAESIFHAGTGWSPGKKFAATDCGQLASILEARRVTALYKGDHFEDLGAFGEQWRERTSGTVVFAPILREGRVIGTLTFELPEVVPQAEFAFAGTVADCAALVFEQAARMELEAALHSSAENRAEIQKVQALLRLARSVAHDLNGLLTIIYAAADEIVAPSANLDELGEDLTHVAKLGKELVERLIGLGGEPAKGEPVDLNRLVEETIPVIRPLFSGERRLTTSCDAAQPAVILAEPLAVKRCLLNLITNAIDALGERGNVSVIVREPTPDDPLRIDAVVLEVIDDGVGMDEATMARAIEPYFTTKSNGHGLGLSEIFGIANRYGGGVRLQSERGKGTRISVAFPRA